MAWRRAVATVGAATLLAACGSEGEPPKQPAHPSAALAQSMQALRDAGCFHVDLSFEIVGNGKPTGSEIKFTGEIDGDRVKGEVQADELKSPFIRIGKKIYQHTTPEGPNEPLIVDGWFENTFDPRIAAPGVLTLAEVLEGFGAPSEVTAETGPKIGGKKTTALKYSLPDGSKIRVLIAGNNEGPPLRIEMTRTTALDTMNLGPFGLTCSITKPPKIIDLPSAYASAAAGQG